ncbi:uncharacterized protein MYCFIDRAFT_177448 [Pseudocercospora fijiensis CIRAD86]|uniref:Uncharacterized protein n=1 Tax=Pseudocercospora fijiensis (strain CIRAD86) TaxID=383855 RepID=M3A7A8_PSEFD|nr:uncharacterized protein MYCFIDRAFT_177448 [Pseudocercospora fijiensis CIRAD86]EME80506.1 hypothetical protein MYCFIDRAFT_177448 [Pseudocercospora fijiensis CIRAD86]
MSIIMVKQQSPPFVVDLLHGWNPFQSRNFIKLCRPDIRQMASTSLAGPGQSLRGVFTVLAWRAKSRAHRHNVDFQGSVQGTYVSLSTSAATFPALTLRRTQEMTLPKRTVNGVAQGTKRRSDSIEPPQRKTKSFMEPGESRDSASRSPSRNASYQTDDEEQGGNSENSQHHNISHPQHTLGIKTSNYPGHAPNHIMDSTNEALGHCLKILSASTIPPRLFAPAVETILDDLILPKVHLSEAASIKRAFVDLDGILRSHGINGAGAEKVVDILRAQTKKAFVDLTNAAMDTEHDETVSKSRQEIHHPSEHVSLDRHSDAHDYMKHAALGSKSGPADAVTTEAELPGRARHLDDGSRTPATSWTRSSPHSQSASLRSRYFFSGPGTDRCGRNVDGTLFEHLEDGSDSPTQGKKRDWSEQEEEIVLKGMRLQRPSGAIAKDLAKIGASRTISAVNNKRAVLQKRPAPEEWVREALGVDGRRTAKQNASAPANKTAKNTDKVSTKASISSDSWFDDHVCDIVAVKWHCYLPSSDELDLYVFYLPVGTPEIPVAPDSAESRLELEQACVEAFKGGERSFQSVTQLADNFWIVTCKSPRYGHRELMECPVLFRDFRFFPEYLPLQPPKTFAANVEQDVTHRELVLVTFQIHSQVDFAMQVDAASSSRKIVAYFVQSPGLTRFYIRLSGRHVGLCFKPVEMHGTCWLCSEEHGDRRTQLGPVSCPEDQKVCMTM